MNRLSTKRALIQLLAMAALAVTARAQCPVWIQQVGNGLSGFVNETDHLPNGDIVYGGMGSWFTVNGVANGVARWDGAAMHPMGAGFSSSMATAWVDDLHVTTSGTLYACGRFTDSGATTTKGVARWNGTAWQDTGADFVRIRQMAEGAGGDLLAAGVISQDPSGVTTFGLVRYDGSQWHTLTTLSSFAPEIDGLEMLPNGDIVMCGEFSAVDGLATGGVARWDGTTWHALGGGVNGNCSAMVRLSNGDLVIGGEFSLAGGVPVNNIARWDGSNWHPLATGPAGPVTSMITPYGTALVVGGHVGLTSNYLELWDGSVWRSIAPPWFPILPEHMTLASPDQLFVAGLSLPFNGTALLTLTCPPVIESLPAGCMGSGGANRLLASRLPLIGGALHTVADGLPTTSFALAVTGPAAPTPLPLGTWFPSPSGCELIVTADAVDLRPVVAGESEWTLAIPSTASLIGAEIQQQWVLLEVGAGLSLIEVTASNALSFRIGGF